MHPLPHAIHFLSLSHMYSKRKHAIAMVEKGTAQVPEDPYGAGDTVRSHPTLAPMSSTSSMKNLLDDDINDLGVTVIDNINAQ